MGKIINKNNKALLVFFVIILVLIGYKEINKKALTEVKIIIPRS
ncbi:MAG: hypothetical protein V1688_04360 [bacterium]